MIRVLVLTEFSLATIFPGVTTERMVVIGLHPGLPVRGHIGGNCCVVGSSKATWAHELGQLFGNVVRSLT
jgi:hypothetical protein